FAFKVGFRLADGGAVGDWASYMIAGLGGGTVNISGPGFVWDTSKGDLVLTLSLASPGIGGAGGGGGLFAGGGGGGDGGGGGESSVAADTGVVALNDMVDTGLL